MVRCQSNSTSTSLIRQRSTLCVRFQMFGLAQAAINSNRWCLCASPLVSLLLWRAFVSLNEIIKTLLLLAIRSPSKLFILRGNLRFIVVGSSFERDYLWGSHRRQPQHLKPHRVKASSGALNWNGTRVGKWLTFTVKQRAFKSIRKQ